MNQKIAFFDIDGTLTSEIDGVIPESAKEAIARARDYGHLMFINSGRCMQNIGKRFSDIGFDGYICGCGTNIYIEKDTQLKEILYIEQPHDIVSKILYEARKYELDILFESRNYVQFDSQTHFSTLGAKKQHDRFLEKNYEMNRNPDSTDFTCDKFVVWFKNASDIHNFRKVSDIYFNCIDREELFKEFVPHGYSKATGIQKVLDYYNLPLKNAYAFGDSNNDLPMLSYVPNSIAMGNSNPKSLFDNVSYITTNASNNGIENALEHFGFFR